MNIGENIRKIRELKNISQDKLSKLSNMPRTSLGRYERNERTPNIDTLNKIANALKVDIDALLYWSNNILICEDVLKFISNLYPDKYYEFGEKLELLGYMLNVKKDDPELIRFLLGASDNKSFYESMSNALGLTYEQMYNWILSNILFSFIEDQGLDPGNYIGLLRKVAKENILIHQSIDNLLSDGLSNKNEKIILEYLMKRDHINYDQLNKYLSSSNASMESLYEDLEIIGADISQEDLKSRIDNIKKLIPILKSYGLNITIFEDNNNLLVNVKIDKDDFYQDFYLDDFLGFIDKIYWGIEREIDYLKHLYD